MFSARGETGELRAGYQCAARLGRWSLTQDEAMGDGWTVEGVVVALDRFWLRHGVALTLVLPFSHSAWEWPVHDVEQTEGGLRIHGSGRPTVTRRRSI